MNKLHVKIKQIRPVIIPTTKTTGSAGSDLYSAETFTLKAGERRLVPTGVAFELPIGVEAQIRPRSGLALVDGVTVLNAPGTIDSDYRGEIKVILINLGYEDVAILEGDRIAQVVFAEYRQPRFEVVQELTETDRGNGGFGSTGR